MSRWFGQRMVLVLVLIASCNQVTEGQVAENSTKYLEAALKAENWLSSVKRFNDKGHVFWPVCPDDSEEFSFDLYHGNSGVIGFYLSLFEVTKSPEFLHQATAGADHLAEWIEQLDPRKEPLGLYTGVAGYGQTMIRLWRTTNKERYKRAALKCVDYIESEAKSKASYDNESCHFNSVTDVIAGSAGICQFLLNAYEAFESQAAFNLAIRCGDGLIADGISSFSVDKTEMLHWRMTDRLEVNYPNFSHGTAGVCHALIGLDQVIKQVSVENHTEYNDRFIVAASKGGEYLKSIATIEENQCLILHHTPDGERLFYLGWCHGPPGSSSMLIRLGERTQNNEFTKLGFMGAAAIMKSELYKNRTTGFWNNVGQCCGTSGVAKFLSQMFRKTQDQAYLMECRRLTEDLLARATEVKLPNETTGLKWMQAEHRVRPDELKAQTGWMQGSAGIGQWLLDMHELEIRYP